MKKYNIMLLLLIVGMLYYQKYGISQLFEQGSKSPAQIEQKHHSKIDYATERTLELTPATEHRIVEQEKKMDSVVFIPRGVESRFTFIKILT